MASRWIIPITGFTENSKEQTGIEKIVRRLEAKQLTKVKIVTPFEWNDPLAGFTNYILRNSTQKAEAMVIAYSWGCGVGFTTFAKECLKVGIPIRVAVLADPVYRSRWLPSWLPFNPLSLTPFPSIKIPASVEYVEWVRQNVSVPAGHDLIAEDPDATSIAPAYEVNASHSWIDDHAVFVEMATNAALCFAVGHNFKGEGQS